MTNTLRILLLRHGQTDANATGTLQGHLPTELNLTGIRQATLLAHRLGGFSPPVSMLISSDLPRAMQTAAPIAIACDLKVISDPAWRERSFGLLEGKPVGERELWMAASGEIDPPGAEPTADMQARIFKAISKLPERFDDQKLIAVVTHGGPIRSVLKMLTTGRLPLTRNHRPVAIPQIINCSILQLLARRYRDGVRWRIACVNDAAHLGEMATGGANG